MRLLHSCVLLALAACGGGGNDVDPRVIPGGGIGDGEIDGEVNVFVIDDDDNPIANATVRVGDTDLTTDGDGLAVFADVSGKQTIAVDAPGFRGVVWVGANGANVTIAIPPLTEPVPEQATLSGSIPGWDAVTVPANHLKAAIVLYSHTDDLGDDGNSLMTPARGNFCGATGTTCDWTVVTRAGAVTLLAVVVDLDPMGTPDDTDDVTKIIGWATKSGVNVQNGIGQTGLTLDLVEAGNLQNLTVDLGVPPASLDETSAFVGVAASEDEVVQLPLFIATDQTTLLAPKPAVFGTGASYRLTAVAQTTSGATGAQSIQLVRDLAGPALVVDEWLVPPTGLEVSRTGAAFDPVAGAKLHQVQYLNAAGDTVLEITILDGTTQVDIPSLLTLPAGALTARVAGIGADLDVTDFSLEEDDDLLFGIAAEPAAVP